ncbi:MAG: hypothetical protein WBE76_01390 [Terracidiphilus sp.]
MHELHPIRVNVLTEEADQARDGLVVTAEREFGAFTRAVTGMFGPEQARLSAEDWLDELASMDCLPRHTSREWRLVTVAALARVTIRMAVALHSPSATRRVH